MSDLVRVDLPVVYDTITGMEENGLLLADRRSAEVVRGSDLPRVLGQISGVYVIEPVSVGHPRCPMLVSNVPFWQICPNYAGENARDIYREALRRESGIYIIAEEKNLDWPDVPGALFHIEAVPEDEGDCTGGVSTGLALLVPPPADAAAAVSPAAAAAAEGAPPSAKRAKKRSASE